MYLLFLALSALIIFGIVDAAMRPTGDWLHAEQNKLVWLLVQIFVPLVGTSLYLWRVRPKLKAAALRV